MPFGVQSTLPAGIDVGTGDCMSACNTSVFYCSHVISSWVLVLILHPCDNCECRLLCSAQSRLLHRMNQANTSAGHSDSSSKHDVLDIPPHVY